jgi:3-hydroxyisobutyrate dehydrogenase
LRCGSASRGGRNRAACWSTTSTVASTQRHARAGAHAHRDGDFIDAPVSGGVEGARNGKLSRSWSAATMPRSNGCVRRSNAYAAKITRMGGVGAGQNTKAVNQVLVAGIAQAVCEGLALGDALGLDAER